jgi:hypothetical protein
VGDFHLDDELVILCGLKQARLLDFRLIEVPFGVHPFCASRRISSIR